MSAKPRSVRVVVALVLLALAFAVYSERRRFIRGFFVVGPGAAAPALPKPASPSPMPPAASVRVVLLDGLGQADADRMPVLRALCDRGLALTVDTGFPTVSLPVERVLWTGLTQQQSGVEFIGFGLPAPRSSLPAQVAGSVAVAESHAFIVESLGFAVTYPEAGREVDELWRDRDFLATASAAVASTLPLVFVHVLRIDEAGHRHGAASPEYAAAVVDADAMLADLLAADQDRSRWLVLSDHGHRPGGGHGGAEPSIRLVRACVAGAGIAPALRHAPTIHLVDVARDLAAWLGVPLDPAAAGRPIADALVAPAPGATLPRPDASRWAIAIALVALGLALSWLGAGRRWWALPWWYLLAYLSLVVWHNLPSLSSPFVYRPLGRGIYTGALPGLLALAVIAGVLCRRASLPRALAALLATPVAIAAACLALSWRQPPLVPTFTAHTSVALTLLAASLVVVALALLVPAVLPGSDRGTPPESAGRGP